jgi:quinolinate synthase
LNIIDKIIKLKKEKNAIILAHNYQPDSIQEIADFTGDSFGLSQKAADLKADVLVFCGVDFMAESAKILSPDKTVLLPEENAICPMARMANVRILKELKKRNPTAAVVSYVNSSAAVKAESDICCTSSNALKIVESLPEEDIIFVPDRNLGHYVQKQTEKNIILWDGFCPTHNRVRAEELKEAKENHPEAVILAHPECRDEILKNADYTGSTAGILDYVKNSKAEQFIIGTEMGLLYRLKKENPEKKFYLLSSQLICRNMKKNSLEKVVVALENLETPVEVEAKVRKKAEKALKRMLASG